MQKKLVAIFLFFAVASQAQNPKLADSLLHLARTSASDTARSSIFSKLSGIPGTPKTKAVAWADSAKIFADDNALYYGMACKAKGDIYYRRSEYDTALTHYSEALTSFVKANSPENQAMCEYSIGNALNSLDRYPEALNAFIECEKTAQRAGSKKYRAYGKNGIGSIYFETKQYAASEKAHKEALVIALEVNDNKLLGYTYTLIGNVFITQAKYNEALEYFKKQQEAYSKTDFLSGVAGALNNIGVCYSYMGKLDSAIVNYEQAAIIKQRLGVADGVSIAYQNISELYALKHDTATSLTYAYKALEWAHKANSLSELAASYHQVAQAYAGLLRFDSAYTYYVRFKDVTDSIYNKKTMDQVAEMTAKYNNEKQEEEITLLQKDNQIGELYNYVFAALGVLVLFIALFFFNRNRLKSKANKLLAEQNEQISQQKKEITDSINYAKRIQESILPSLSNFQREFPESFILYRPKDIVSGDFYWIERIAGKILVAAVDCTGHGVPGAMMSVLGYNLLTEAAVEKKLSHPSEIMQSLNTGIIRALQRQQEGQAMKDGMDIALCALDPQTLVMEYCGVFNPLYLVRKGGLKIFDAERNALGQEENKSFINTTIPLEKGDCIYLFTDGFADQFGGPQGKKYKYSQLQKLILSNAFLPMNEQQKKMEEVFDSWKGNLEQVDDVLIIGIKIL
jgi:serine phosphatase RsbU (regulator of sigma subunit)